MPGFEATTDDVYIASRTCEGDATARGSHTHRLVTFQTLGEGKERKGGGKRGEEGGITRGVSGRRDGMTKGAFKGGKGCV